jgi:hypothetical protein
MYNVRDPKFVELVDSWNCSEVGFCYQDLNWDSKMAVVIDKSLFGGGR